MVELQFDAVGGRIASVASRVLDRPVAVNPETPGSNEVAVHACSHRDGLLERPNVKHQRARATASRRIDHALLRALR